MSRHMGLRTIILYTAGVTLLAAGCAKKTTNVNTATINNSNTATVNTNTTPVVPVTNTEPVNVHQAPPPAPTVVVPIAGFFGRVTKKPFGIYITPKTSPVQPEKFTGYHTGADAETSAAEAKTDVSVYAMAKGTVVFAGHVNGYGGVMIIRHTVGSTTFLALYGHLRISSFTAKNGTSVSVGQKIAVLGTGYSSETDGERKHLHFGLIKGTTVTYRGYVSSKSQLSAWYDPVAWLKDHGVTS